MRRLSASGPEALHRTRLGPPRLLVVPLFLLVLALALAPVAARAEAPSGKGWKSVRESPFTFSFRSEDERLAASLAAGSGELLERIVEATGLEAPRHVDVVLAPSRGIFDSSQPHAPPAWAAGTAWPDRSEIYLKTRLPRVGPSGLEQVFAHEVVHVLLGQAWREGRPPRWLNEGLASYLAGELTPADHGHLLRAALGGGILPLESFTRSWPRGAARARLAYVQSVDFVAFLDREGAEVLRVLLGSLAAGEEVDRAVLLATGESLESLERRWRGRITFWHAVVPVVGSSGLLWVLTSLLFLVAAWRRRRAFHTKLGRMAERERMAAELRAASAEDSLLH